MRLPSQAQRQPGEQAGARRRAFLLVELGQVFDFDRGHVHLVFAFALAAFAAHAQFHGAAQRRVGERVCARLGVQRGLEQAHAPAGGEAGLAGGPIAGAHHGLVVVGFAGFAVDADGHGLGEVAAALGDVGVGVALACVLVGRPVEKGFHGRCVIRQRWLR